METIVLLGELGKRYGRRHRLDVASPAEAVRAMCANFKDFAEFLSTSTERNVGYRIITGKADIGLDEIHNPAGKSIIIAPVIGGAGGKFGKIIIGALIVAAVIYTGGIAINAAGAVVYSGLTAQIAFSVGLSLVIGGVSQLLAPTPPKPRNEKDDPSYLFNGPVNTTVQGVAVPVGYGRMIVGSAVISAGIDVQDISA